MEKKKYFVVVEYWENGEINLDVLETEYDEGTEELYDLIEEKYMHNLNTVFWVKLDSDVLAKLRKLMEKLNEIVLKKDKETLSDAYTELIKSETK